MLEIKYKFKETTDPMEIKDAVLKICRYTKDNEEADKAIKEALKIIYENVTVKIDQGQ